MNKGRFIVYKSTYAQQLIQKGFEMIGVAPDKNNPRYNVYFFQEEDGIRETLAEIIAASH